MIYDHYNISHRLKMDTSELTAIDLGCGAYTSGVACQIPDMPFRELTSVEAYKPDFEKMTQISFKAEKHIPICIDIREVEGKYDIVFMFDVLEHFTKEDGNKILDKIDELAKVKAVLFFPDEPDGFHRKHTSDDNVLQEHLSFWREPELITRGYKVERITNCHEDTDGQRIVHFDALWATKTYA